MDIDGCWTPITDTPIETPPSNIALLDLLTSLVWVFQMT